MTNVPSNQNEPTAGGGDLNNPLRWENDPFQKVLKKEREKQKRQAARKNWHQAGRQEPTPEAPTPRGKYPRMSVKEMVQAVWVVVAGLIIFVGIPGLILFWIVSGVGGVLQEHEDRTAGRTEFAEQFARLTPAQQDAQCLRWHVTGEQMVAYRAWCK